jgi:hypothetical protein
VAGRAFEVAIALAVQNRDAATRERVAIMRTRLDSARRAP